jgi:hypothetical protein
MEILSLPIEPNKKKSCDCSHTQEDALAHTFVMEGIVLVKLIHLQLGTILPLVGAMKLVKADGIFITYIREVIPGSKLFIGG